MRGKEEKEGTLGFLAPNPRAKFSLTRGRRGGRGREFLPLSSSTQKASFSFSVFFFFLWAAPSPKSSHLWRVAGRAEGRLMPLLPTGMEERGKRRKRRRHRRRAVSLKKIRRKFVCIFSPSSSSEKLNVAVSPPKLSSSPLRNFFSSRKVLDRRCS